LIINVNTKELSGQCIKNIFYKAYNRGLCSKLNTRVVIIRNTFVAILSGRQIEKTNFCVSFRGPSYKYLKKVLLIILFWNKVYYVKY